MHKLLERQLKRLFGSVDDVPEALGSFVAVVDQTYEQADADRKLLERSLDLTSKELLEANADLRSQRADLERRVAERTESIRRSEARYRELFETSRDVIYLSTREGKLLDINPAGVELFGWESREKMLAEVDARDIYANPADREELLAKLDETGFVRDAEFLVRRPDGRELTVLATITGKRGEDGRVQRMRGIARDVTGQRELERQLREAQKMEAVGRLAGGVAHDFNNLLTAIIGYGDLLREELSEDDPLQGHIEEIRRAAGRGAKLTRQLLAFSRRQVMQPTALDLNRVAGEMENLLRRVIGDDVELVADLDPDIGSARADPGQIEQVILNLVLNARDAMPDGGTVRLSTSSRKDEAAGAGAPHAGKVGRWVVLEVTDSGVGIEEGIREQIFEPFFTTKSSGGTGLGLASVYGIVRQSGGRIEVDSTPGRGSTFRVFLPSVEESPTPAEPAPERRRAPAGRETILLVEDDPVVFAFTERYLGSQGYEVLKAADGEQALQVAAEHRGAIDLLLTDVVMPRMSGIELAERMLEQSPELRILLMSGYAGRRLTAEGGDELVRRCHFLHKPFNTDDLGWKVRQALAGAPAVERGTSVARERS